MYSILHEHFRNVHQRTNALTNTTTHTRQGRSTGEIPCAASRIKPLSLGSLSASQIFQTPRQTDAKLGEEFCECAARDQRHDDQEKYLEGVPAHVLVYLAQEMANAVDEARPRARPRGVAAAA